MTEAPAPRRRLHTWLRILLPALLIAAWLGAAQNDIEWDAVETVTYRDEEGRRLFDLPGQPLPPADTPLPPRLLGHWDQALLAYQDIPFAALVIGAVLLEAQRSRRGVPVLALLALAGLLRPEAWLLAGVYWLWLAPVTARPPKSWCETFPPRVSWRSAPKT